MIYKGNNFSACILVTGGAGYIGAHVCKTLAASGYLPVTLDNLSTEKREFVRWGPLVQASIADAAAVRETIAKYDIHAVIDLAASINVAESVRHPLKYYENNVAEKIAFMQAVRDCGIRAFVFSSSAAVYGEPQAMPIPEIHPTLPTHPYGWSKLFCEQLLADLYLADGLPFTALRYFNAAGASPDGEIGEAHDPQIHLIPRACLAHLGVIPPLEIFGNDYATPDGTAIRDYVHVTDLATAHVLALEALLQGAPPTTYNLGSGGGLSIHEVLRCFDRLGIPVPHRFAPRRPGDPPRLVADITRAEQHLSWQPVNSDIETIISSAYAWHQLATQTARQMA